MASIVSGPNGNLRIGLFAIGLEAYWDQFEGLRQRLIDYAGQVARRLGWPGVDVVNLGLIDSPEKAVAAGHAFRRADVDLLFLHVTTYALSSTVLPVVRRVKAPVIILNLSPGAAIDYASFNAIADRGKMTGEWLASESSKPSSTMRTMAGPGDCQRLPALPYPLLPGYRDARQRSAGVERNRRLAGCGPGGSRDGAQPPGSDGPLLRGHARRLFRPDAALRDLRRAYRDPGGGRAGGDARGGEPA